ncbi:MAG: phosphoglycerate kinase [Thermoplasmata archaeon]|nr:phosphoglycerate kinase [Thermoplasmata archaeon]
MTGKPFYTLDDFDFRDKRVLLRVDINSPIDPITHDILDDTRMRAIIPSIESLEGSKLIILAHQSKPGKSDFTTLRKHAKKLSEVLDRRVKYIDSLFDNKALAAIKDMRSGDILLLENTRFYSEDVALKNKSLEIQANSHLVTRLSSVVDYYVCDAFAAAHRSQPTLVGFAEKLPAIAGRLMESELVTLSSLLTKDGSLTAILGGAKVEDSIEVLEFMLEKGMLAEALTGGVVGNIFIKAQGHELGTPNEAFMEKEVPNYAKLVEQAKRLLEKYPEKILVPNDLSLYDNDGERTGIPVDMLPTEFPIYDIGLETTVEYIHRISHAKRMVLNGPMGVFELEDFEFGTKQVLKAMTDAEGFSVVGGGHTAAAVEKFGLKEEMDHVSTGGGALINYLTGKELPVVEALKRSKVRCEAGE